MGKPSDTDRKILSTLFPSSNSGQQKRKFNPTEESIAEKKKAKKKAAIPRGGKPRTITTVLLEDIPSVVPRGVVRRKLTEKGRIKKVQIRRSMGPSEVRRVLQNAFSEFRGVSKATFLKCNQDNTFTHASPALNGDDVAQLAGGGSLYLLEVKLLMWPVMTNFFPPELVFLEPIFRYIR